MIKSCVVLAALLLALVAVRAEGKKEEKPTSSRLIGPGVAGFCMSMGIHPKNPDLAVTGVDMGLFFVTRDGGKSWLPVGPVKGRGNYSPGASSANGVVFHPEDQNTFWLTSGGVFKTSDGGRTTEVLLDTGKSFTALAVDPGNPKVLYAGEGGPVALDWEGDARKGLLYKTTDGGKHWTALTLPKETGAAGAKWTTIVIDPSSKVIEGEGHERLYAIGSRQIYRSEDAGKSWQSLYSAQPGSAQKRRLAVNLVLVPEKGREEPVLYGSFSGETWKGSEMVIGGVFRSEDRGQTWSARNQGLESAIGDLSHHAPRPRGIQRNIVLLTHSAAAPERLYCSILGDVFRSDDLGLGWVKVTEKPMEFVREDRDGEPAGWFVPGHKGNISNQLFDERFINGRLWSSMYHSMLAVAQTDADRVMMAPAGLLSRDGGKSWHTALFEYGDAVKPGRFGDRPPNRYTHKVRSTGAQVIVPTDISFDPFDPDGLSITFMDVGAFISRDHGDTWALAWEGILRPQADMLNQTGQVLFDARKQGRVWIVQATHGKAPLYGQHLYRSDDGGLKFEEIPVSPLKGSDPNDAVVDLLIEPNGSLLTMTTKGVFRSEDEGRNWTNAVRETDQALFIWPESRRRRLVRPRSLLAAPADPGTYFFRREMDQTTKAGFFRSRDGATSWEQLGADRFGAVSTIAFSENVPGLIYIAAVSPERQGSQYDVFETQLWRSHDLGGEWERVPLPKEYGSVISVLVHPRDENLLYLLCGSRRYQEPKQTALLRSTDGGKHWEMVDPGLSMSTKTYGCNRAAFNPRDAREIYLLTDCGAWQVWDAKGKP